MTVRVAVRKGDAKGHLVSGGESLCGRPGQWLAPVKPILTRCKDCDRSWHAQNPTLRVPA